MKTFLRWTIRILLVLLVLAVVAVIGFVLVKDSVAKSVAERSIRDATGMDTKISKLEVGLLTPTAHMEGLRIYNTPQFGGSELIDVAELRVEYAPEEVRNGKIHLKTLRLNIAEVNVVKDKDGKTNLDALKKQSKKRAKEEKTGGSGSTNDFGGVDTIYLSLGKIVITDLASTNGPQVIDVGLKDETGHDLKSEKQINDWLGAVLLKASIQAVMKNPTNPAIQSLIQSIKIKL